MPGPTKTAQRYCEVPAYLLATAGATRHHRHSYCIEQATRRIGSLHSLCRKVA